jgi:hypothetical protein
MVHTCEPLRPTPPANKRNKSNNNKKKDQLMNSLLIYVELFNQFMMQSGFHGRISPNSILRISNQEKNQFFLISFSRSRKIEDTSGKTTALFTPFCSIRDQLCSYLKDWNYTCAEDWESFLYSLMFIKDWNLPWEVCFVSSALFTLFARTAPDE